MLHILQRQKKTSNPTRLQRHCIPLILIYIPWTYISVQQSSQNNNSWLRFFSASHPDRQQAGVHIGILIFYLLAINPQWNLASFSFVSDSALLFPEITKILSSTSHKWFCSTIGIIVFSTIVEPPHKLNHMISSLSMIWVFIVWILRRPQFSWRFSYEIFAPNFLSLFII